MSLTTLLQSNPSRRVGLVMLLLALAVAKTSSTWANQTSSTDYVGAEKCAACHSEIHATQRRSHHARTLRPVSELNDLLEILPLRFHDKANALDYRLERSVDPGFPVDLIATKNRHSERLRLLWVFGAGRHGITFVGRADTGDYGQSLVSWYRKLQALDITTGLARKVSGACEGLADWFTQSKREHCFGCHVTRNPETSPEKLDVSIAGVQCERCHGPGESHIQAITSGEAQRGLQIENPGKFSARKQVEFCGTCHGEPPKETDLQALAQIMTDKRTVRLHPKRLILSRCYDESKGRLKCTTCHDPHDNLPASLSAFDNRCQDCHGAIGLTQSLCPVAKRNCVSCHMPKEKVMAHSSFADHWIRVIRKSSR